MRIPAPIAVAVATAVGGVALMSGWGTAPREAPALAGASGYARVATGDCNAWNAATIDRRLRFVAELGDHFGHPSPVWRGAKLPDAEARRVLQQACRAPEAADIKLYKIYSRALTFRAYRRYIDRLEAESPS